MTSIKPASHRLESNSSNCNVHSAASTPKHSNAKLSVNSMQKQRKPSNQNQKDFFNLKGPQLRKKVIVVFLKMAFIVFFSFHQQIALKSHSTAKIRKIEMASIQGKLDNNVMVLNFQCMQNSVLSVPSSLSIPNNRSRYNKEHLIA